MPLREPNEAHGAVTHGNTTTSATGCRCSRYSHTAAAVLRRLRHFPRQAVVEAGAMWCLMLCTNIRLELQPLQQETQVSRCGQLLDAPLTNGFGIMWF